MSNPRIMVTIPGPLLAFLDHEKRTMGRGYSDTLRSLALNSREFAEYRKATTTVVKAKPDKNATQICPHGHSVLVLKPWIGCHQCSIDRADSLPTLDYDGRPILEDTYAPAPWPMPGDGHSDHIMPVEQPPQFDQMEPCEHGVRGAVHGVIPCGKCDAESDFVEPTDEELAQYR